MPIIRMKLVPTIRTLSTHGNLFQEVTRRGKKALHKVGPHNIRLTIEQFFQHELTAGTYHYIFNAQNGLGDFEIVTSKNTGTEYVEIDTDSFSPTSPFDTFQIACSFTVT